MQALSVAESSRGRVDRRLIERKVREKLADWQSLLTRNVQDGRQLLREVLTGPMRFTPENGCFRFEGQADMNRLLQGVIPVSTYVASPPGTAH